ncbi:hypothetical protein PRIPAC_83700 [Pristionchus pacificus]|uniref:Uncharacterized protein n=1 Tax=Pristionchus pacificus TaxID=54126 RepID=A0A2A6BM80_PRIPA|nr:hypothetical protein PRIPAC_83700 [Pristionchus pacificus]|eukprot:PDM67007.1 hypothetical protein PRIPAC_48424 [Pristionchus pacificus]
MKSVKTRAKLRFLACEWSRNVCMSVEQQRPKEQRCFRFFHVKSLSIGVAVAEIVIILWQALVSLSILSSSSSTHSLLSSSIHLVVLLLSLTAITLLLSGILCQTPMLLVPHLLMQGLIIVTLFGLALFSLYTLFCGTSVSLRVIVQSVDTPAVVWREGTRSTVAMEVLSKALIGLLVIVTLCYILLMMINIWTFHVVLDCYRWLSTQLEEKQAALSSCLSSTSSSQLPIPPPKIKDHCPEDGTDL